MLLGKVSEFASNPLLRTIVWANDLDFVLESGRQSSGKVKVGDGEMRGTQQSGGQLRTVGQAGNKAAGPRA